MRGLEQSRAPRALLWGEVRGTGVHAEPKYKRISPHPRGNRWDSESLHRLPTGLVFSGVLIPLRKGREFAEQDSVLHHASLLAQAMGVFRVGNFVDRS